MHLASHFQQVPHQGLPPGVRSAGASVFWGLTQLLKAEPPRVLQVAADKNKKLHVARVLGLFVGVLLAFFAHYLTGGHPRMTRVPIRYPSPPAARRSPILKPHLCFWSCMGRAL